MKKIYRENILLLLLIGSVSVLSGCAAVVVGGVAAGATSGAAVAADPRSADGVVSDQKLRGKVEDVINAAIPENNVEVTSYDHNILLTGQVNTEEDKTKAETVAKDAAGVKKIYNYITVGHKQSASQSSKDSYLTSAVKSNLLISKGVNSNDVKVVTTSGVVYLMGMIDPYQAKKMTKAASEVDGVKKVVSLFEYVSE